MPIVGVVQTKNSSSSITFPLFKGDRPATRPIPEAELKAAVEKAAQRPALGTQGAKVLQLAYSVAKKAANQDPTYRQVVDALSKVTTALAADNNKGRINDGFVDSNEAEQVKTRLPESKELIAALYDYLAVGPGPKPTPISESEAKRKATFAQIEQAVAKMVPAVEVGFQNYDAANDRDGLGLSRALRAAAKAANIGREGTAAILTALNAATRHSDSGNGPTSKSVKAVLELAQKKLQSADGAAVVDLDNPSNIARDKDGVVTGLELSRKRSATGNTSRAVLKYAATLRAAR